MTGVPEAAAAAAARSPRSRAAGGAERAGKPPGGAQEQLAAAAPPASGRSWTAGRPCPCPGPGPAPARPRPPPTLRYLQGRRARTRRGAAGPRPSQLPGRPWGQPRLRRHGLFASGPGPAVAPRQDSAARGVGTGRGGARATRPQGTGTSRPPRTSRLLPGPQTGPAAKAESSAQPAWCACLAQMPSTSTSVAPSGLREAAGNAIRSSYQSDTCRAKQLLRAGDDLCLRSCPK